MKKNKFSLYKIVCGEYHKGTGKNRKVYGPGKLVKIGDIEAKKMGKMVVRMSPEDGNINKLNESKPDKIIIPPARAKRQKPKKLPDSKPDGELGSKEKITFHSPDEKVAELLKHDVGAFFFLTNGDRIRGKQNSIDAQRKLLLPIEGKE